MHGGELYGDARRLRGLLMGVRAHCNSPGQLVDETCSMYFICNLLETFCRKMINWSRSSRRLQKQVYFLQVHVVSRCFKW